MKVWYQNRRTKHKRQGEEDGNEESTSDCDTHTSLRQTDGADGDVDCGSGSDSDSETGQPIDSRSIGRPPPQPLHPSPSDGRSAFRISRNNGSNTDLRTSSSLSDGEDSAKRKQGIM